LYEIVIVDEVMRRLIHEGAPEVELVRQARNRTRNMLDDGWNKVLAGITTADEVLRVTHED
jgi:general secretion pathway protein E